IRRERATSNICTNNALNALAATVYLATAGPHGLAEVATRSTQLAHVAQERFCQIPGVRLAWEQPFLFEFALELPKPAHAVVRALLDDGFLAGRPLGGFAPQWERLLRLSDTETRTRAGYGRGAHAWERAVQA